MERRWYKVWPLWVPKILTVEKPLTEYVREWASYTPDRIAINFYGREMTYRELDLTIDKFANGLVGLGIREGDRVGIFMENCPQFVISYFAILRAGGIVVPINPMFKRAELQHELNDAEITTLVCLDYLYPLVKEIQNATFLKTVITTSLKDFLPKSPTLPLPEDALIEKQAYPDTLDFLEVLKKSKDDSICKVRDLSEVCLFQYTGGTTGIPKGAMITHHGLSYAALATMFWYRHRDDDVHLGVTPFFHIMGQEQLMNTPLISGGKIVILSRFSPEVVAEAISRYRCTYWVAPTTAIIALLNLDDIRKYDFSSLRCLWTGGSPVSVELQTKMREIAPMAVIGEGYGHSETIAQGGAITPLHRYKPGFVGIPQVNDVKIVDLESGSREMDVGQEGEIVIKGPLLMIGYWKNAEETKNVLRDGWFFTGDIGLMDEEGYLKILGRKRELIKSSGYSVFPAEVENLLYKHPAIKEVAVIGVKDPYRGESAKAFVVLKPEFEGKIKEQDIIEWAKENMAAYKRPRFVEFRKDLPKSAAGKILRRVLVEEEMKKE